MADKKDKNIINNWDYAEHMLLIERTGNQWKFLMRFIGVEEDRIVNICTSSPCDKINQQAYSVLDEKLNDDEVLWEKLENALKLLKHYDFIENLKKRFNFPIICNNENGEAVMSPVNRLAVIALKIKNHWEKLGKTMNVSSNDISTIEKDHQSYPAEEKAYQLLWKLSKETSIETFQSNFQSALIHCMSPRECKDIFKYLQNISQNTFSDENYAKIDEEEHYISYGNSGCKFYIVSHSSEREQELMKIAIDKFDKYIEEHMRNKNIRISIEAGACAWQNLSEFHEEICKDYVKRYYGNQNFFPFNYDGEDENLVAGFKYFLQKRGAGFMIKDYNLMKHFEFLKLQEYSTESDHFSTFESSHQMDHIGVEEKNRFIYFIKKSNATSLQNLIQDIKDSAVYLHMFFMLHKKSLIDKISALASVIVIPTESKELIDEIRKSCSFCGNFVITEEMFKDFSDKKFCEKLLRLTRKTRKKLHELDFNEFKYELAYIFGFMASEDAALIPCLSEDDVHMQMENAKILFNPIQLQIANSKDRRVLLVGDYGSGKTLVARSLAQKLSLDLERYCFVHYVNFGTSNDLTRDMHRFAETLHDKQKVICESVGHFHEQSKLISIMRSIISNHKRYVKINLIFDEVPINDWSESEVREFIEILKEPQFTDSHCLIICQPMQTERSYTKDGVIKSKNKSFKEQIEMLTKEFNFKEKKLDEIFRNTIKIQELAKFTKGILEKWSNRYFEETSKKQVEDFDPNEEKEKGYEFSDNQVLRKIEKEDVEESRNTKEVSSDSGLIQVESLSSETSSSQLQGMSSSSKETPIEFQKGESQSDIKKVKYQSTDDFIEPSNDIHVESNFDLSLKSERRFKEGASDSSALLENFVLYISDGKALHNIPGDDPLLYFPFESKDNYDKLEKTCLVSLCLENISELEIFIEKDDITLIHFETETPVILLNALDMLKDKNKFKHLSIKSVVETQGCEYNNLIIYLSIAEYHMRHYLVEAITRCKCNLIFIVMKNDWNLAETNVVQDMIQKWEQHSYVEKVLYEDLNYESLDELSRNYGKHFDFHHKEIVRNTPRAANVLKRFVNPNKFDVNYSQKMENQEKILVLEEITSRVTAWEEFANVLSLDELNINYIKNSVLSSAQRTLEVMKSFTHPNPPTESWEFWRKYLKEFEDGALAIEQLEMKFPILSSEIADRLVIDEISQRITEWRQFGRILDLEYSYLNNLETIYQQFSVKDINKDMITEAMKTFKRKGKPFYQESWEFWRKLLMNFDNGKVVIKEMEREFPFLIRQVSTDIIHRYASKKISFVGHPIQFQKFFQLKEDDVEIAVNIGSSTSTIIHYQNIQEWKETQQRYFDIYNVFKDITMFNFHNLNEDCPILNTLGQYLKDTSDNGFAVKGYNPSDHLKWFDKNIYVDNNEYEHYFCLIGKEKIIMNFTKCNKQPGHALQYSSQKIQIMNALHKELRSKDIIQVNVLVHNDDTNIDFCSVCIDENLYVNESILTDIEKFKEWFNRLQKILHKLRFELNLSGGPSTNEKIENLKKEMLTHEALQNTEVFPSFSRHGETQMNEMKKCVILLTLVQFAILHMNEKHIFIRGSYGSGKTIVVRKKFDKCVRFVKQEDIFYYICADSQSNYAYSMESIKSEYPDKNIIVCNSIELLNSKNPPTLSAILKHLHHSWKDKTVHVFIDEFSGSHITKGEVSELKEILPHFSSSYITIALQSMEEYSEEDDEVDLGYQYELLIKDTSFKLHHLDYSLRCSAEINEFVKITSHVLEKCNAPVSQVNSFVEKSRFGNKEHGKEVNVLEKKSGLKTKKFFYNLPQRSGHSSKNGPVSLFICDKFNSNNSFTSQKSTESNIIPIHQLYVTVLEFILTDFSHLNASINKKKVICTYDEELYDIVYHYLETSKSYCWTSDIKKFIKKESPYDILLTDSVSVRGYEFANLIVLLRIGSKFLKYRMIECFTRATTNLCVITDNMNVNSDESLDNQFFKEWRSFPQDFVNCFDIYYDSSKDEIRVGNDIVLDTKLSTATNKISDKYPWSNPEEINKKDI